MSRDRYRTIWSWSSAKTIAAALLALLTLLAWFWSSPAGLSACCPTVEKIVYVDRDVPRDVTREIPVPGPLRTIEKITLGEDTFFEFGRSRLRPDALALLRTVLLPRFEGRLDAEWKISAVGYADRIGSEEDNLVLARKRAESVIEFLRRESALSRAAFATQSRGEAAQLKGTACQGLTRPDEIRCLQPNRRVELLIEHTAQHTGDAAGVQPDPKSATPPR